MGDRKLSERAKIFECPLSETNMPLPGQARIHTCPPPLIIEGIDTIIASHDGGHRGTGGTGVEVGEGEYTVSTKRYVRWQIGECQVTGGRGGVCMCTGMTNGTG